MHSCGRCRQIVAMHEEEHRRLRLLAGSRHQVPQGGGAAKGDCPSLTEWASLAAGMVEPERREALLAHAAQCDPCGAALHALVEDFTEPMTGDESEALEALASAEPDWQRGLARRMAEASRGHRGPNTRTNPNCA